MRSPIKSVAPVGFALSLLLIPAASRATNMVTQVAQNSATPSVNWDIGIWKTNVAQTVGLFSIAAGNNYALVTNATAYGNNANNTRARNSVTNTGNILTFIGDALTVP